MSHIIPTIEEFGPNLTLVTWANVSSADTMKALEMKVKPKHNSTLGSLQMSGTWGGATGGLSVSNDGGTYIPYVEAGNPVEATEDAWFELSSSSVYSLPTLVSGTSDSVTFTLALRG